MGCESGTCETGGGGSKAQAGQASCCESEECCCPIEKSVQMWNSAFCKALGAVQVDLLKERIKKNWGPVMEKEADAVVQAMGAWWHSKLTAAKSQVDLRDNIRKIIESAKP